MSWTLCTSGAAIALAGDGANSELTASGATLALWSDQIEGEINAKTRWDWVADYPSVNTNFKGMLQNCAASGIAKKIIMADMSGYTSRMEATTMIDVLHDDYIRDLEIIKEQKNQEKMT